MKSSLSSVELLCVPFDRGGAVSGAAQGPRALLQCGLAKRLERASGCPVDIAWLDVASPVTSVAAVAGDVDAPSSAAGGSIPQGAVPEQKMKHLAEVLTVNLALCEKVRAAASRGRMPLILGGDHSLAIGSIAGVASVYPDLGVLWVDAHADLNTEQTTPSGNIHGMPLAASLGLGEESLVTIGGRRGKLAAQQVVLIGCRSIDEGERDFIRQAGIRVFTMRDIDELGMAAVMRQALSHLTRVSELLHVSFDVDALDPGMAPGVGTPVRGGLSYREARLALEMLSESGRVVSADVVELNPSADASGRTSEVVADLVAALCGEAIL